MRSNQQTLVRALGLGSILAASYLAWRLWMHTSSVFWVPVMVLSSLSMPVYLRLIDRTMADMWIYRFLAYLPFPVVVQLALWQNYRRWLTVEEWALLLLILFMHSLTGPDRKFTDLPLRSQTLGKVMVFVLMAVTIWWVVQPLGRVSAVSGQSLKTPVTEGTCMEVPVKLVDGNIRDASEEPKEEEASR